MPRVPDLNPVQADTRPDTGFRADASVDNPSLAAIPGQQNQQLGAAMTGAGDAGLRIAADMQNQINQTQVDDALNQQREKVLDLTYNPQTGYQAIKGGDVVQREGGILLADEYGQKLQEQTDKLTENLGNDAQRRLFAMRANDIATSFRGNIEAHVLKEYQNHGLSVQNGAIKLAQDEAERNWSDHVQIDTNLKSVQAAVWKAGKLQGQSGDEILAKAQEESSKVHLKVIDAALQNNNSTYAQQYLGIAKSRKLPGDIPELSADGLLKANIALIGMQNKQEALHVSAQVFQGYKDRFSPDMFDRMVGITRASESGNQDYKPDGTAVVSSKGAKYAMQVMPDTAKNPGYGIAPATDDSPSEYNRIGTGKLKAMLQRYGNPPMAWAAYNAGEGTLDTAMKQAQKDGQEQNWVTYLPKETQAYVRKNMDKLQSGAGTAPLPTLSDAIAQGMGQLGPNPSPQRVLAVREQIEQQYKIEVQSRKEAGDQAFGDVLRDSSAKQGDWNNVDGNLKSRLLQLAPEKMDDAIKYSRVLRDGENRTNMGAFNFAMENPDKIAAMPPADFNHFQVTNFSRADQEKVEAIRAKELNGVANTKEGMLSNTVFNQIVNNRLLQIVPKPTGQPNSEQYKTALAEYNTHVGTIKHYLSDSILSQQKSEGTHFTQAELAQRIDRVMATDVKFQNTALWGMGWRQADTSQKMMAMRAKDIPENSMGKVMSDLASRGITSPTDDQKLRLYWMKKQKGEL